MKPAHELKKEREERFAYERGRRISKLEEERKDLIDKIYGEIEEHGSCIILDKSSTILNNNDDRYGYRYGMDAETYYAVIELFEYYGYAAKTASRLARDGGVLYTVYIYLP